MNPQARPGGSRSEQTPPENSTQAYLPIAITDELDAMGLFDAEEIGRGGFGVVYRCAQRSLDRVVAVKVLSTEIDEDGLERFLREEHAMGRLSGHPNIVDILQVDVTPSGRPFIVMPYATRGSLEQVVRDSGPLSWVDSLRVGVKLSGAIETAHRAQVLHRDVKPANVLLSRYGEPQLTDFGIARIPGGFRTSTSLITGSPAFTAPEVLKGDEPTVRSDIYGLGSTLFALLTGHAAYERQAGRRSSPSPCALPASRFRTRGSWIFRQMWRRPSRPPWRRTRAIGRAAPWNSATCCAPCRASTGTCRTRWRCWTARSRPGRARIPLPRRRIRASGRIRW